MTTEYNPYKIKDLNDLVRTLSYLFNLSMTTASIVDGSSYPKLNDLGKGLSVAGSTLAVITGLNEIYKVKNAKRKHIPKAVLGGVEAGTGAAASFMSSITFGVAVGFIPASAAISVGTALAWLSLSWGLVIKALYDVHHATKKQNIHYLITDRIIKYENVKKKLEVVEKEINDLREAKFNFLSQSNKEKDKQKLIQDFKDNVFELNKSKIYSLIKDGVSEEEVKQIFYKYLDRKISEIYPKLYSDIKIEDNAENVNSLNFDNLSLKGLNQKSLDILVLSEYPELAKKRHTYGKQTEVLLQQAVSLFLYQTDKIKKRDIHIKVKNDIRKGSKDRIERAIENPASSYYLPSVSSEPLYNDLITKPVTINNSKTTLSKYFRTHHSDKVGNSNIKTPDASQKAIAEHLIQKQATKLNRNLVVLSVTSLAAFGTSMLILAPIMPPLLVAAGLTAAICSTTIGLAFLAKKLFYYPLKTYAYRDQIRKNVPNKPNETFTADEKIILMSLNLYDFNQGAQNKEVAKAALDSLSPKDKHHIVQSEALKHGSIVGKAVDKVGTAVDKVAKIVDKAKFFTGPDALNVADDKDITSLHKLHPTR